VIVLGSTGSVGTQTLATIEHLNELHGRGESSLEFEVVGLACAGRSRALLEQVARFGPGHVAIASAADEAMPGTRVLAGDDAAERLVREVECDLVVSAIVGTAGLAATHGAVSLGRNVALANKETLVAAGDLVVSAARRSGAKLLPLDSEHAAAWQCMGSGAPPFEEAPSIRRLILTASGGPFRTMSLAACHDAPPEAALDHPTWSMGPKNTIDSASLMNKGLELIEAHHLFALASSKLDAVIHPQSFVHAMVELEDSSLMAQMACPDMRLPIQQALTHPARLGSPVERADVCSLGSLTFEAVDPARWPAIGLARRAIDEGCGAVLNGANEAAVAGYLAGRVRFGEIVGLVEAAMDRVGAPTIGSVEDALAVGEEARGFVEGRVGSR
jgi:1-deoxy-D-xylulose-5-phosphate reductoisomerase